MEEPTRSWATGLPTPLLEQIVLLSGPRAASRLATVCKPLKDVVTDDRMWSGYHEQYYGG